MVAVAVGDGEAEDLPSELPGKKRLVAAWQLARDPQRSRSAAAASVPSRWSGADHNADRGETRGGM